jgi:glycosyltransferase involved in cell wall biosynthesis
VKLALVTPYPGFGESAVGGVAVAATRLAAALGGLGIEVLVIGICPSVGGGTPPSPVTLLSVDERWSILRKLRPLRAALTARLESEHVDIIHAHDLLPAGYAATHLPDERMATVVTAHGSRREDTMALYRTLGGHARWLLARRMTIEAATRADAVIGVHPEWQLSLPLRPSKFVYIPNIVDDRFFAVDRRPDGPRVLYCGGPRRIKGWDRLLSAWPLVLRQIPDARLHAPGCVEAADEIDGAIAHSIELDNWLSTDGLVHAMAEAAVVVIPSRFDLAPIALSEAWAARVPVIAAAVGGIPALATTAASLVHEEGPGPLAAEIVRSLTREGPTGIVQEAYRRVQDQRGERVAAAHLELYESLVAG